MEINVTQQQGRVPVTVLQLKGVVDSATYGEFEKQAQQALDSGTQDMLLDLSDVPYMSSAGLRVLNQLFNRLRGDLSPEAEAELKQGLRDGTYKSPHLKLLNPTPRVVEVLKLAGLDMFLEIHRNLKEAIASF